MLLTKSVTFSSKYLSSFGSIIENVKSKTPNRLVVLRASFIYSILDNLVYILNNYSNTLKLELCPSSRNIFTMILLPIFYILPKFIHWGLIFVNLYLVVGWLVSFRAH